MAPADHEATMSVMSMLIDSPSVSVPMLALSPPVATLGFRFHVTDETLQPPVVTRCAVIVRAPDDAPFAHTLRTADVTLTPAGTGDLK
jgi:hypothetical protein